jgi:hypothetical protein
MAAAAATANGTILAANPRSVKSSKVQHSKEKRSSNGYVPKFKKKCQTPISHGRKKLVEYIVEYIIESGRRERRERAETYNRLHCIE